MLLPLTELTVHRSQPSLDEVLSVMRRSSIRRGSPDAAIDLPGIFGVARGAAPCLWVSAGADVRAVQSLLATTPDILEVNVEAGCATAVAALTADGCWEVTGESSHQVISAPVSSRSTGEDDVDVQTATALDMRLVRRSIARAFHIPVRVVEASYPDDFLDSAAPVELLLAKSSAGELMGTIAYRGQDEAAMIFALTVNSEHRRRGLATALVAAATGAAFASGAEFVHGLTNCASTRTVHALGGRPVGRWVHLLRSESDK